MSVEANPNKIIILGRETAEFNPDLMRHIDGNISGLGADFKYSLFSPIFPPRSNPDQSAYAAALLADFNQTTELMKRMGFTGVAAEDLATMLEQIEVSEEPQLFAPQNFQILDIRVRRNQPKKRPSEPREASEVTGTAGCRYVWTTRK